MLVDKVSGGVVDPDDYQVCIDARPLNAKNRSKKFVLPKIADVIKKAKKATMMADLDLQNAFHQILLDEFSSNLSAFTDPFTGKRYQMTNMWFGESGSATQMQKVVQAVLGMGEPGTEDWRVYVDNMLVLYEGDKVEEFAHQVRRLVEKLTEKGLKLKPAKCKVGYKKMRILGHLCEKGAASIDPEKVKCFSKMEQPKSFQALREVKGVEKEGERRKLVEESHQEAHEGGYHLFMKLLRKGVFWKEMKKECREEVKKCVQCLRFNVGKRGFFPLRVRGVMYPMQQVHVDHLGTLEVVEGKFQHVLVVVDAATRFVWLEPVESCSGRETKEKLEKIFRVVGWPGTLVSDGGSAFVNEEIERMLVGEGVERQVATPGAHEHNAPVERWIQEVRAVMNKKLELKRDGWASKLARIQEVLNNRYVVPLKSTPFDLFFARNPNMRKKSRGEAEGDEKRVDVESNAGKLRRRNEVVVEEVYPKIAEGVKRVRQEGCDKKLKKRRRAKKFGVGELVMVRVDRKSKQDLVYEGVFEVVKFVKEKAEYQLARMGEKEVRVRMRHENLKRAPSWKSL